MELGERQEDTKPAPRLCYIRGSLALVGRHVDAIARSSMSNITIPAQTSDPFHVTIATQDELCQSPKIFDLPPVESEDSMIDLGVSCEDDICFNVIFWKEGMEIRRMMGLPFKFLHLHLSGVADSDILDECMGSIDKFSTEHLSRDQISSIVDYCNCFVQDLTTATGKEIVGDQLLSDPRTWNGHAELLDLLAVVHFKTEDMDDCLAVCKEMMSQFPEDPRGYFRCADYYFRIGTSSSSLESHEFQAMAAPNYCWKLAMVLYGEAIKYALTLEKLQDQPASTFEGKLIQQSCQAILHCAEYTEFGCLMTWAESEAFPKEYLHLSVPWNPGVRNAVLQAFIARGEPRDSQLLSMDSHERLRVYDQESRNFLRLPRFFRWITPFRMAAMSKPQNREDVELLAKLGIVTVVTLTKEAKLDTTWFTDSRTNTIKNVFVPVTDYKAPTTEQVDYFFSLVDHHLETNSAILVHCYGGKGRTGTFIACYLARYGFIGVPHYRKAPKYSATEVIQTLRKMRPGSIENDEQELFIAGFVNELSQSVDRPKTSCDL